MAALEMGRRRVNFDNAACRTPQARLVDFFADARYRALTEPAKAIRRACPVKAECLAKFGQEPFGVIGGLDELERRRLNSRNERSYRVLTGPPIRERAGRY